MIFETKVYDGKGKLKKVIKAEQCSRLWWANIGFGMRNEFTGAEITNEERGNKVVTIKCIRKECGKVVQKHSKNAVYCSGYCRSKVRNFLIKEDRKKNRVPKKCKDCNKEFYPHGAQKYCLKPCVAPQYQKKKYKSCKRCGKTFKSKANKQLCGKPCVSKHY